MERGQGMKTPNHEKDRIPQAQDLSDAAAVQGADDSHAGGISDV